MVRTDLHVVVTQRNMGKIRALVSGGLNINEQDEDGWTPLAIVSETGDAEMIKLLASLGANVHLKNKDGQAPILISAFHGHIEAIKALVALGADPNNSNKNGITPVYIASILGKTEVIKALASFGANINIADDQGKTPLQAAKDMHVHDSIKCLTELMQQPRLQTLSGTAFVRIYDATQVPEESHDAMYAVEKLINVYGKMFGVPSLECNDFYMRLRHEAVQQHSQGAALLDSMELLCTRLWTSALTLKVGGQPREFCSIVQHALRTDDETLLKSACVVIRAVNQLCVTRRKPNDSPIAWPSDYTLYRGGNLPREHFESFFKNVGTTFRFRTFFATSCSEDTAIEFMNRSQQPKVLWTIKVDSRFKCLHVNYVDGSMKLSAVPTEKEFLFVPYSVFTISSASYNDDYGCYMIELKAAIDNNQQGPDGQPRYAGVPLAPWS